MDEPPIDRNVPILTEVVHSSGATPPSELEAVLAEVQTRLAARAFELTDELLRSGFAELQATLFEQVSAKLRARLPEIIDATLHEYFDTRRR